MREVPGHGGQAEAWRLRKAPGLLCFPVCTHSMVQDTLPLTTAQGFPGWSL